MGGLPAGFAEIERDDETGKTVGWEPVEQSAFVKWHAAAVADDDGARMGSRHIRTGRSKVNGNPENAPSHMLLMHEDAAVLDDAPRDFGALATWLHAHSYSSSRGITRTAA